MTVPAFVWRHGSVLRPLIVGGCVGLCAAFLAWLDSGLWFIGVIVLVVAGAARRGESLSDARLADLVAAYSRGLHAAAQDARMLRPVIVVVLVVAVGTALWDGFYGSWGNVIVSAVYLVALLAEVIWWPRRKRALLANSVRAAAFRR